MMSAGCNCKASIGCVDARVPMRRASYVSLYKWPESDAEFVKSLAMARRRHGNGTQDHSPSPGHGASSSYHHHHHYSGELLSSSSSSSAGPAGYSCSPRVVDSYSCRQMYLRSYTFSKKKETVPERTMACLGRVVRDRAVFPLFGGGGGGGGGGSSASSTAAAGSDTGSVDGRASSNDRVSDDRRKQQQSRRRRRRRKKKKKGCAVVRRLHEASCAAVRAVFRRLLACTTSVDVADGVAPPQP